MTEETNAALIEARRLVAEHGSIRGASIASGIHRRTLQHRLARARVAFPEAPPSFAELPPSDLPPREIIRRAAEDFRVHEARRAAERWFRISMPAAEPVAVAFVGDPHVDDNGCNWPLLEEHIDLLEKTPGFYAVGGNDLTNNWVGRLVRLYADQNMSRSRAWSVVKHLLVDSDVKWLWHHPGNHDEWNEGVAILRGIVAQAGKKGIPEPPILCGDSRVEIAFPNGASVKVWHRHHFAGNSQWNRLHGNQKAALMGEQADIYAAAHTHGWAVHQEEHEHRGNVYWLIRSRGYKHFDKYADALGFGSQSHGSTVTAVLNPHEIGPRKVHCYADMREAAEYLTWLRARHNGG